MERPERVVLVIIGALFARWGAMAPVLWVLAVLSTITVVHRIIYTYQQTHILDAKAAAEAAAEAAGDAKPQNVTTNDAGEPPAVQKPRQVAIN
jgi:CDP-diacylglycerol--glycerol-3-phosphate 3-phosphatidyltransferase